MNENRLYVNNKSNDVKQTEDEVDLILVDILGECCKNASHRSTSRQILSITADKVSYQTSQSWIPGITRYRCNVTRQHAPMYGQMIFSWYEGDAEVENSSVLKMYVSVS